MNPVEAFAILKSTVDNSPLSKQERTINEIALQALAQAFQQANPKPEQKPSPEKKTK